MYANTLSLTIISIRDSARYVRDKARYVMFVTRIGIKYVAYVYRFYA